MSSPEERVRLALLPPHGEFIPVEAKDAAVIIAELYRLREDAARLDWLLNYLDVVDLYIADRCVTDFIDMKQWELEGGESDAPEILRAARGAIDAAMKAKP